MNQEPTPRKPRGRPTSTGRGTGTETRKTGKPLGIRMLPEDRSVIEEKARDAGLSLGDYMRKCALGSEIKSTADKELIRRIVELHAELRRQGGLQKDLAKQDRTNSREYSEILEQMKSLLLRISKILEGMG